MKEKERKEQDKRKKRVKEHVNESKIERNRKREKGCERDRRGIRISP